MTFTSISETYVQEWVTMGLALWPHSKRKPLEKEFRSQLPSDKYETFLALDTKKEPIGFINLSLRSDYVEGSTSSPVGHVEGIYVKPEYRKQGVAKELIRVGQRWAKKQGCKELASDAELRNRISQKFHAKLGFKKADTIVHFIKKIK